MVRDVPRRRAHLINMDQVAQHASVMAMDFVMDLEQNQARVDVAALATMLVRHAHPASVDLLVAIATRSVKKME